MKKVLIGKIISVFGIKGEVKIMSYADNPQQIENYPLFDEKGNSLKLKISNKNKTVIGTNSSGNSVLIAKIEGVIDRNAAEKMRGQELFTNRENFDETAEDEFYYVDLIGLDVIDFTSKKIGRVKDVVDYGAGGILEIEFTTEFYGNDPKKDGDKLESFPFKNEIFPEVNVKEGFIRIEFPEVV